MSKTKVIKTKVAKKQTVKAVKLKPFQKMLNMMLTGKPVTKEEFETLLGDQIQMYRISTYIWHMKSYAGAVVKVVKEGRKAVAYQVCNVSEVKEYMKRSGTLLAKQPEALNTMADLKAEPEVVVAKPKTISAKDVEVLEVTEITA
jgi:hypothetical protein